MSKNGQPTEVPVEQLTEHQQHQVIRTVAHDAARDAYLAEISLAVGVGNKTEADEKAERAKAAAVVAAERGAEGPYLTEAERVELYKQNLSSLERMWLEVRAKTDAGIQTDQDPEDLAKQHEKLLALKPKGAEKDAAETKGDG